MRQPTAAIRSALSLVGLALLAAAWLACAKATPISEVRQRASELDGKEVTIAGKVSDTMELPFVGSKFYEVDDGSGKLWVQTGQALPATGEEHRVVGTLQPGFNAGAFKAGLVLQESRRN